MGRGVGKKERENAMNTNEILEDVEVITDLAQRILDAVTDLAAAAQQQK